MDVQILHMIEGAKKAEGLTVVIDVFRAFSLECYLMARGAGRILPVGSKERAYVLPGFDYGNSPSQTEHADLRGKTIVHTTSAGTQGVANALHADEILTGSLVNARAVARYIRKKGYEKVSLVCMGLEGLEDAPEDVLCGRYIKGILEGQEPDMRKELETLRKDPTVQRFFDPENQVFPEADYWMCTEVDRFDFVLRVDRLEEDVFEVHRTDV